MFGRKLRSQLDLLKPNLAKAVDETPDRQEVAHDKQTTPRRFHVGDCVYARNYSSGPKWLPGQVVQVEGSVLYHVKLKDGRVNILINCVLAFRTLRTLHAVRKPS